MNDNPKRVGLKILRLDHGFRSKKTHFCFRASNNSLIINDLNSEANFYLHSWMQMTAIHLKESIEYELVFTSIEIKTDDQLIVF